MMEQNSTGLVFSEPLSLRKAPLPHYFFPALPLPHAVLTRYGGESRAPYHSLNLSFEVGDDPACVRLNRKKIKELLGCEVLVSARQVHGKEAYLVRKVKEDLEVAGYDILITSQPGVGLLIKQADCQAVILYEPEKKVLALLHAGWRGLVAGVIERAIRILKELYGVHPEGLWAGISPSLQPCCAEFRTWSEIFPESFSSFRQGNYFDLPALSFSLLRQEGLRAERILVSRLCTKCRTEFFSYRREGLTGRFGTVARL